MSLGIDLAERGYVPDVIVRLFMRRLLKKRLAQDRIRSTENGKSELIDEMSKYWDYVRWNDVALTKEHVHEAGVLK